MEARRRAAAERTRDDALLAGLRGEGDGAADRSFEAIFRLYVESLIRFAASYVRDGDVAREIVSDVFLAVWDRRATITAERGLAAYLFGAVRNRAHNAERSRQRRAKLAEAAAREPEPPGFGSGGDEEHDRAHALLVQRVHAALAQLAPARREAMVLRWEHGMTPEQIADVMGLSRTAVYHLLDRARKTLRDLLGPDLR